MSTTSSTPIPSPTSESGNDRSSGSNSPLIFFVALGFGVVFTNIWIILGVKYCLCPNRRVRVRRLNALNAASTPPDGAAPAGAASRRGAKVLLTLEQLQEKFPTMEYSRYLELKATRKNVSSSNSHAINDLTSTTHLPAINTRVVSISESVAPKDEDGHRTSFDTHVPRSEYAPDSTVTNATSPAETASGTSPADLTAPRESGDGPAESRPSQAPADVEAGEEECAICTDAFTPDVTVRPLSCWHAFHVDCIDRWLTQQRDTCPLCNMAASKAAPLLTEAEGESAAVNAPAPAHTPAQPSALSIIPFFRSSTRAQTAPAEGSEMSQLSPPQPAASVPVFSQIFPFGRSSRQATDLEAGRVAQS